MNRIEINIYPESDDKCRTVIETNLETMKHKHVLVAISALIYSTTDRMNKDSEVKFSYAEVCEYISTIPTIAEEWIHE